jgi:hypothetical protein
MNAVKKGQWTNKISWLEPSPPQIISKYLETLQRPAEAVVTIVAVSSYAG